MRTIKAAIPGTATRNQQDAAVAAADSVPATTHTHTPTLAPTPTSLPLRRLSAAAALSAASSASAFALAVPPGAAVPAAAHEEEEKEKEKEEEDEREGKEADTAAMSLRPSVSSHFRRLPFCRPRSLSPLPGPSSHATPPAFGPHRPYSSHNSKDPRIKDLGRQIHDDFAQIREKYATPKHPIVLAHGLLGFAELKLAGDWLPGIQYWHGISEALTANGIEVFTSDVPASGTIETRAARLADCIAEAAAGRSVNIVAHSMGGLDCRYLISRLERRADVRVLSLTTVATPHHGSTFADYLFDEIGDAHLPTVYKLVEGVGLETGAFAQLTQRYMRDEFNPSVPDDPAVRYFSYGAMVDHLPFLSPFRHSRKTIQDREGPNDGLVSVASSRWGEYKGTLLGVNHLDLINWTNRVRWTMRRIFAGKKPNFNAIAFYLHIADMLAKEGL